jgi:hypothetical protein
MFLRSFERSLLFFQPVKSFLLQDLPKGWRHVLPHPCPYTFPRDGIPLWSSP